MTLNCILYMQPLGIYLSIFAIYIYLINSALCIYIYIYKPDTLTWCFSALALQHLQQQTKNK